MQPELMISLMGNAALAIVALILWASKADSALDREENDRLNKDLATVTHAKDALAEKVREQGREIAEYRAAAQSRRQMLSEAGKKGNAAARAKRAKPALPTNSRAKAKA